MTLSILQNECLLFWGAHCGKQETSLKVQALTRLLQDNEPISSICEDLKTSPVVLGQWRREVIGGLPLVFDKSLKKAEREKERYFVSSLGKTTAQRHQTKCPINEEQLFVSFRNSLQQFQRPLAVTKDLGGFQLFQHTQAPTYQRNRSYAMSGCP